jgi:predicted nucleotidyltransferase
MLTEADIERIAAALARSGDHLAVGTFGSHAVGAASARSDLDLFVITDTREPPAARRRTMRRALFEVMHPLDIHVFTPEEFEAEAYEYLSFAWVIVRQARLYHWSEAAAARVPSLAAAGAHLGRIFLCKIKS